MDVEGLQRWRAAEPSPPQPRIAADVEDQAEGEGGGEELSTFLCMCLLKAPVLLSLRILLLCGTQWSQDWDYGSSKAAGFADGEPEIWLADTVQNRQDETEQLQASVLPDNIPSLQSIGASADQAGQGKPGYMTAAGPGMNSESFRACCTSPKNEEENALFQEALQEGKTSQ